MRADLTGALAALADPTRRALFERLARSPRAVGALAQDLPITRPAVSHHLKVLKAAGLVADQADGARRVYAIDPTGLRAIRAWLNQFERPALNGTGLVGACRSGGRGDGA